MIGTIGCGDLLYLPPSCLFAELTDTTECFGFKFATIPALASIAESLHKLKDYFQRCGCKASEAELGVVVAACIYSCIF